MYRAVGPIMECELRLNFLVPRVLTHEKQAELALRPPEYRQAQNFGIVYNTLGCVSPLASLGS